MSKGGGKEHERYRTLEAENRARALSLQEKASQPTQGQKDYEAGREAFQAFKQRGNYSENLPTEALSLRMYRDRASNQHQMAERLGDLEGVGASSLGQGQAGHIAVQQSRQRRDAQTAQQAGEDYERAFSEVDRLYTAGIQPRAEFERGMFGNLAGQSFGQAQYADQMRYKTRKQSALGDIFGGILMGVSAISGAKSAFGGG